MWCCPAADWHFHNSGLWTLAICCLHWDFLILLLTPLITGIILVKVQFFTLIHSRTEFMFSVDCPSVCKKTMMLAIFQTTFGLRAVDFLTSISFFFFFCLLFTKINRNDKTPCKHHRWHKWIMLFDKSVVQCIRLKMNLFGKGTSMSSFSVRQIADRLLV